MYIQCRNTSPPDLSMRTKVQKWGNSLAVRIPKPLAEDVGLDDDTTVELSLEDGTIVLKPVSPQRNELQKLLAQCTEENRHEETDWGPPVGKEVW